MESQEIYTGISFRAIIIGLSCAVAECLVAPYNDYVIRGVFLAGGHFPVGPLFILNILILIINVPLKKINPKLGLSPQELIIIWCIMIVAAGIPSSGMMRYAITTFVSYKYFATPENEWESHFHQYIPSWRVVRNEGAIKSFYDGLSSGESIPWKMWITPLFIWAIYVLIMYFVMICLSVLLRKQWVEIEKCAFPLVKLPIEMSEQQSGLLNSFFKSRLMWVGFALPVFIHTINGLNSFFPKVPHIPGFGDSPTTSFWLDPFLVGRPWDALRPFQIVVFWSMVGFSYLLTLEVSFSLWFFFLFFKFQCLLASLLGFRITGGPGVGWTGYTFSAAQEVGACLTFAVLALWKARYHIKNIFRSAFHQRPAVSNSPSEMIPHRLTTFGLIMGIFLLVLLNCFMGMSLRFAFMFVIFLMGVYITLTWLVISGGIPFVNPSFSAQGFFLRVLGTSRINPSSMTSLFMHPRGLTWDLREFMMPNVMNSLKASDEVRIKQRHLLIGMVPAMILGLFASYYSVLKVCYKYGAVNLIHLAWSGYLDQLNSVLISKTGPDWANTGFIIFGGTFMLFLTWIRNIFVWWPIHPIGYIMFGSWASFKLWFSIFLGWIMKYGILKHGGLKVYRTARPAFLGLVLGEITCAGIWAIIGMIISASTDYRILPD